MQDFPANSKKPPQKAEPREKLEQITSAETVRRKRGIGHKFKETFIAGNARTARENVVSTIVIPAIQEMLSNALRAAVDEIIYGEGPRGRRGGAVTGPGRTNYSDISRGGRPTQQAPRTMSRRARARFDFDDIVIPSRQEATDVIDRLFELLSRHESASVADLYALTGIQGSHTDLKWGWTSLRGSRVVPLQQGGYLLDLPEPEPLD